MKNGILHRLKMFSFVLAIGLLSIFLLSCGGGGGSSDGGAPDSETSEYHIYTNPTDGRLSRQVYSDGTSITYYGTKDGDGNPLSLTVITVESPSVEGEYVYEISDDELVKIHAPTGDVFEIEPLTDSSIRLKSVSASGEVHFSQSIESGASNAQEKSAAWNSKTHLVSDHQPAYSVSNNSVPTRNSDSADNTFTLTLTKCGAPVDNAIISMTIEPSVGDYLPYAENIGKGVYEIATPAPVDMASAEQGFETCKEVGKKIDKFIEENGWLLWGVNTCEQLKKTYDPMRNSIPSNYRAAADKLMDACTPALITNIKKISAAPNLGADFTRSCQGEIAIDHLNVLRQDYTYNLEIKTPNNEAFYPDPGEFYPSNPKDLSLELPPEISCEGIYTVPADPKAAEGYRAIASMICPDPDYGTNITISWENPTTSDPGDTRTETIYTDKEVEISVPAISGLNANDESVTDVITVEADTESWSYPESQQFKSLAETADETKKWLLIVQRGVEKEPGAGQLPELPAYYKGTSIFSDADGSSSGIMRFAVYESGSVTLHYKGEDTTFYQSVYGTHENGLFTIAFNDWFSVSGSFDANSMSCSGSNEYGSASFSGTRVDYYDFIDF
jgi:hypothetical protein